MKKILSLIALISVVISPLLGGFIIREIQLHQIANDEINLGTNSTSGENTWLSAALLIIKSVYESPFIILGLCMILKLFASYSEDLANKVNYFSFLLKLKRYVKIILVLLSVLILGLMSFYISSSNYEVDFNELSQRQLAAKVDYQQIGLIKKGTPELYNYIWNNYFEILLVTNNTLYFAIDKLYVYDLTDIKAPVQITVTEHRFKRLISTNDGSYLFGLEDFGFTILDTRNKKIQILEIARSVVLPNFIFNFLLSHSGNTLYLISNDVYVFNVTDKKNPILLSTSHLLFNNTALLLSQDGTKLIVAGYFFSIFAVYEEVHLQMVHTAMTVQNYNLTDLAFDENEFFIFARFVSSIPEIQFYISGICVIFNLLDPICSTSENQFFVEKVPIKYHGIYSSKKSFINYIPAGSDGIKGMYSYFLDQVIDYNNRETFGFQVAIDESFMVVLDGSGLKTTRMIFPIYYKAETNLDIMIKGTTSYSFSPNHIYMDPDEKFFFLYNRADADEAGSDLVYYVEIGSAQLLYFPYEKIQKRVYNILENPSNNDSVYFSAADGVREYNLISHTLSDPKIGQPILALTRISETNKLIGIYDVGTGYGCVIIFNADMSVFEFCVFIIEIGGSFLAYSNERIDYIVGDIMYLIRLQNLENSSEPPQIFINGLFFLDFNFSNCIIDKDKNYMYAKDTLGVFMYYTGFENFIMTGFYIRSGADNLMVVDSWRNIIYYYTDRTLYFLEPDYDNEAINELFYISLPYAITNMWISPKENPVIPYLYLFSNQEILIIDPFPIKVAFLDQTTFQIGTKTTLIVYLIENEPFLGSYAYNGLSYDEFSLTEAKIFDISYNQGRSYQTFYDLPIWITFNPSSRELVISPENKLDVGEYNLFLSFSKKIISSDFDTLINENSTFTSQDIFSELVKLGYLDNSGFLTLKFENEVITDLPSRMIDLAKQITLILSLRKYFTNYKISVVASLSLDVSTPPALKISALDSVQISVQITLSNAIFSPNLAQLRSFAQLSEDRTSLTISGLKDAVDYSLTQISMNIVDNGTNITAGITINDFMNTVLEVELSNITQFIYVNNQPSLAGNPFNLLVIPLREWAYEIPFNLFEDSNDRGDIISYDLFIVDHISNTLTPIPPFFEL